MQSAFYYIVGWLVLIVFLFMAAKTKVGHTIIYYILWMMAVFLIVTHASFFQKIWGSSGTDTSIGAVGPVTVGKVGQ